MWQEALWLLVGMVALCAGAHYFVEGSVRLARFLGLSSLWVGMVVVGVVTSIPEMILSILSLWDGHYGLALGNPIGSYIANIGLVLGVAAIYRPLKIRKDLFRYELPILTLSWCVASWILHDELFSRQEAYVLLFTLCLVFVLWFWRAKADKQPGVALIVVEHVDGGKHWLMPFLGGFIVLWLGAQAMVKGAVGIAVGLGVSDLTIGLTIVAVGTSLPELAASITSVRRGQFDLALGNIIGSNVLCLLGIMAIPGLWESHRVEPMLWFRDVPVMGIFTVLLWKMAYFGADRQGGYVISRVEGLLLLAVFIGYLLWVATGAT